MTTTRQEINVAEYMRQHGLTVRFGRVAGIAISTQAEIDGRQAEWDRLKADNRKRLDDPAWVLTPEGRRLIARMNELVRDIRILEEIVRPECLR